MLQSDHIFPLKPLDKDLLENSQSVCGWVWGVCVYEKTWASFRPSSQMGRSVCVFVFPISLIIFTDSPTSVTFPMDTWYVHFYSLLFVSRACVCVYLLWLLSHTRTKKKSFYKSKRTAARSLRSCAAACMAFQTEWFSIWSTDEMGFFVLDCSVGVSYFRG